MFNIPESHPLNAITIAHICSIDAADNRGLATLIKPFFVSRKYLICVVHLTRYDTCATLLEGKKLRLYVDLTPPKILKQT